VNDDAAVEKIEAAAQAVWPAAFAAREGLAVSV
jgi:hypothetical protein